MPFKSCTKAASSPQKSWGEDRPDKTECHPLVGWTFRADIQRPLQRHPRAHALRVSVQVSRRTPANFRPFLQIPARLRLRDAWAAHVDTRTDFRAKICADFRKRSVLRADARKPQALHTPELLRGNTCKCLPRYPQPFHAHVL